MNAAEIIVEIKQAGGEIWAEGERLKFRDIPARLVPAIREHNTALLALLKEEQTGHNTPRQSASFLSQLWPRNQHTDRLL